MSCHRGLEETRIYTLSTQIQWYLLTTSYRGEKEKILLRLPPLDAGSDKGSPILA
jgi:hypothetical protein